MYNKIIRRSAIYVIWWLILFILQFALGIILLERDYFLVGIVLSMSAAIFFALTLKGLINTAPRIVMDDEGITATEFNGIKILWIDIEKVNLRRFPRVGRVIFFELYDESKYETQLTNRQRAGRKLVKAFGETSFCIMTEGLDTPPSKLYEEIVNKISCS